MGVQVMGMTVAVHVMSTASVTEVIGTCWDDGSNCTKVFAICPGANFGIAAANWLYPSDNC